jgi:hypothetical protein
MLKRLVVGGLFSAVLPVVMMGQSWSGVLNSVSTNQKNVSQAGIDWSLTGIPGGPPDANWTQCGATINASSFGTGATDATSAINAAIQSCGTNQYVLLGPGTFLFNSGGAGSPQLLVNKSNVELRGSGANQTILNSTGTNGSGGSPINAGWVVLGTNSNPPIGNDVAITAGATAGSTSITVANASNFSVGGLVVITELNDTSYVNGPPNADPAGDSGGGVQGCSYCDGLWHGARERSQIVEVTSVSGSTIGISPALYTAYTLTPHALPYNPVRNSGVRDLQIYGNGTHPSGQNNDNSMINMFSCSYCWVYGVEFNYPDGDPLQTRWSFRFEILSNYSSNGFNKATGYNNGGFNISYKSSAGRIENNIFDRSTQSLEYNFGAAGNVFAYNYTTGAWSGASANWLETSTYSHGAHPQFNLFEGNIQAEHMYDVIHGSTSQNTSFRNWWIGTSLVCSPTSPSVTRTTITCSPGSWATNGLTPLFVGSLALSMNIVGDIVGSAAELNAVGPRLPMYSWPGIRPTSTAIGMAFGLSSGGDNGTNSFDSTAPFDQSFIHGVYNNTDGETTWASGVSQSLAPSIYLSGPPSWWGSTPWPAIGPDVTGGTLVSGQGAGASPGGHVNSIPAMSCYYNFMGGKEGGAGSPLTFTPEKCYGAAASTQILPPTGLNVTVQ